jgi:hypothetical protein
VLQECILPQSGAKWFSHFQDNKKIEQTYFHV